MTWSHSTIYLRVTQHIWVDHGSLLKHSVKGGVFQSSCHVTVLWIKWAAWIPHFTEYCLCFAEEYVKEYDISRFDSNVNYIGFEGKGLRHAKTLTWTFKSFFKWDISLLFPYEERWHHVCQGYRGKPVQIKTYSQLLIEASYRMNIFSSALLWCCFKKQHHNPVTSNFPLLFPPNKP